MARYNKEVTITLNSDVSKAISGLDSVAKQTRKVGYQFRDVGRNINSVFNPAFNVMMTGITAASAAMTGLGVAALSVGGSFQKQMSLVQGVAGATNEELEKMKTKAQELGASLPVSASEAAEAMYNLASSGMSVNEILASINDIVNISIAQNYGLEESSALITTTLKGFKIEAEDTNKVVDVFSNGISSSMLNMTKLGEAMKAVAPLANSLGMSLEDTVAAMEVLADTGLEGSQIGTSLRRVLSGLLTPSREAALIFESLGVEIADASGKMRDFSDIMKDFKGAGLTAEQALQAFGDRGAVAAIALTDAADSLDRLEEELRRYGRTQEQVNLQQETFENKMKSLRSAIEADLLVVFDQINERAGSAIESLTEIVRATGEWLDATEAIDQVMDGFFRGLGLGLPSVENFRDALDELDPAYVAEKFEEFGAGVRAVFDAFKTLVDAIPWKTLIENLDTITYIIMTGWVVGKITLLGDAIVLLGKALRSFAGAAATVDATIMGSTVLKGLFGLGGGTAAAAMLGTAGATAVVYELMNPTKLGESAESMEQIEKALNGDKEAFKQLAPEMQRWLEATNQINDQLEGQNKETETAKVGVTDLAERMSNLANSLEQAGWAAGEINFDEITETMTGSFEDEILEIYEELGQAGLDAMVEKFELLPGVTKDILIDTVNQVGEGLQEIDTATTSTAQKTDTLGISVGQSLIDFSNFAAQARTNAIRAVQDFGVDADEAGETFKSSVVNQAEATAKALVEKFEDPQMRNNFISALRTMGESAGNALYTSVADALDKTNQLMGDAGIIRDTLQSYGYRDASVQDWDVEIVSESQTQTMYKVTNDTQELFRTVMKGQQDVAGYDWTKALDIDGMKTALGNGLDGMSALAGTQGDVIGSQLEGGIKKHIDSAVAYAKAKLKTIKVSSGAGSGTMTASEADIQNLNMEVE